MCRRVPEVPPPLKYALLVDGLPYQMYRILHPFDPTTKTPMAGDDTLHLGFQISLPSLLEL